MAHFEDGNIISSQTNLIPLSLWRFMAQKSIFESLIC